MQTATTTKNETKLKITKPMLIAQIKTFDEFKDKKDSALMSLKKEVLVSTLNRLMGKDIDSTPTVDSNIIEVIKNKPKVEPKKSSIGSGMTAGMDFSGMILATENDLIHFSFGFND
jgi:hypothetical protein